MGEERGAAVAVVTSVLLDAGEAGRAGRPAVSLASSGPAEAAARPAASSSTPGLLLTLDAELGRLLRLAIDQAVRDQPGIFDGVCGWCLADLPADAHAQTRYCSYDHRQRAWRLRRALARVA